MAKRLIPEKIDVPVARISEDEWTGENSDQNEYSNRAHAGLHSPNWQAVKKKTQRKLLSAVDRIISLSRRDSWTAVPKPLLGDPLDLPVAQLGPVIGKVTENSARILLEVSERGKVTMVLERESPPNFERTGTSNHRNTSHTVLEKVLEAGRPGIFVFENLDPETTYRVKLKGCQLPASKTSSFCTFPAEPSPSLSFAVISCNKIFITEKEIPTHSDLWAHLAKSIEQKKINMCFHLGDQPKPEVRLPRVVCLKPKYVKIAVTRGLRGTCQIYGDGDKLLDAEVGPIPGDWSNCFMKSKEVLKNMPKDQWEEQREKIRESYRKIYRRTWSHPYTAYCLANCPNLMIYDDHEVRDNWADLPGDWNSNGMDFFIARCAWEVNLEYQRQLHDDVDFDQIEQIDKDYHFHLISGVGIMFLDIRGSRSFHRVPGDTYKYLGSRQWQDIENALKTGGMFESAQVLLLCTPAPLVFLEHNFTDIAKRVPILEDFKGHWSAALHFAEQKKMVHSLCHWKFSSTSREVLVLGGDVHCGGHSDIQKHHEVVFRQLTTSAIANHPLPKSAYYVLRAAGRVKGLGAGFSFFHHDWTRSRNYGVVNMTFGSEGNTRPEVTAQLIKGKFMIGIREGPKVSNLNESDPGCFGYCCRSSQ